MSNHSPAPTPSRCVYGFVLYLGCYSLLALYILWAYIPTSWFEAIGLTYLPGKYWAVVIPIFVMTVILISFTCLYPGITLIMTPSLSSMNTITDNHALYRTKEPISGSIPPIYDIPLSEVNRRLFLKQKIN